MYIKCTGPFEQGCICVKQYWEKNTSSFHENIWKQQRLKTKEETTYTNTHQPKTSPSKPNLRKKNKTIKNSNTNQPTKKQPSNQPTKKSRWSFQTSKELYPEPAPLLAYPSLDPVSRPRTALYHGSE